VLVLKGKMVGLGGLEPPTSPLSEGLLDHVRSRGRGRLYA